MITLVLIFYGFQITAVGCKRFGWNTKVAKQRIDNKDHFGKKTIVYWILYIPAANHQDFFIRISPHIIPNFLYKVPLKYRTYTVKYPDGTQEVKFWPEINKNLPPVDVRKGWKNSRKQLSDWVFKKCESLTPEEKLSSLQIWKKVNKQPRLTTGWYNVAFEIHGQWYTVNITKARNLIEQEKGE